MSATRGAAEPASAESESVRAVASLRRGGMLIGAGQVAAMVVGLASSMLVVRIAAPAAVASYLLVVRSVAMLGVVLRLGLVPAVLRFAPLCRGRGGEQAMRTLRWRLLALQAIGWALATPLVVWGWPWAVRRLGAPELATVALLVLVGAIAVGSSSVQDAQLRAARLYARSVVFSQLAVRLLLVGALVALLLAGVRPGWRPLCALFVAAQLVGAIVIGIAAWRLRGLDAANSGTAQAPPPLRTLATTAGVMGLHSLVAALLVTWDLWLLSWAQPHREVAVYGVMLSILQGMAFLPAVANLVIPQEFSRLHRAGRHGELEALTRGSATTVAILALAIWLLLLVGGRELIRIAFGGDYVAGWPVLLVLAVGRFVDGASGAAGFLLQMTGNHVVLLGVTAAAAVVELAVGVPLAVRYGGIGLAFASSGTLVALNLSLVVLARRRVGVRTFAYLAPARWREVARAVGGGSWA